MSELSALRLYFPHSARARPTRFWHRFSAPVLSHRLLLAAHRAGIEQAILHAVGAGYLQGRRISHHHIETPSAQHPLCIELVDREAKLRAFLHSHADELAGVRAVLMRCELAL